MELARAWVLGDKLACYAFQNAVIDAFVEKINGGVPSFSTAVVSYIYEHTLPDDPLRWMMVEAWVNSGRFIRRWNIWYEMCENGLPQEFLCDFMQRLLERVEYCQLEVGRCVVTLASDVSDY